MVVIPLCAHVPDVCIELVYIYFFIWMPQFLIYYGFFFDEFTPFFPFMHQQDQREGRKTQYQFHDYKNQQIVEITYKFSCQRMNQYLVSGPLVMATKWNLKFWQHSKIKASKEDVHNSHHVFTKATFDGAATLCIFNTCV